MEADRRPSTRWYWITSVLALLGLVGAVTWGVYVAQEYGSRLEALTRSAVPGTVTVEVTDPGTQTIHYEDPRAQGGFMVQWNNAPGVGPAISPVDVVVTGPSGDTIPTVAYESDLRFDVADRVAVAVATFDTPEVGIYTVEVTGDVPETARVSVGNVVDGGVVAHVVGAVVLFVVTLVVAAAIVVVVAYRRSRTPQQA